MLTRRNAIPFSYIDTKLPEDLEQDILTKGSIGFYGLKFELCKISGA
jgi:hypothetical protein